MSPTLPIDRPAISQHSGWAMQNAPAANDTNRHELQARDAKVKRIIRGVDQVVLMLAESAPDHVWHGLAVKLGEKRPPSEKTISAIKRALRERAGIVEAQSSVEERIAQLEARLNEELDPFIQDDLREEIVRLSQQVRR